MPMSKTLNRRSVIMAAIALALVQNPAIAFASKHPKHVLFICQYGSVKSPIARELFRRRAEERGIDVVAWSRGISPEAHLSPTLLIALKADGIDPGLDGLHKLTHAELRRADVTVLFDTLPAKWRAINVQDWTDTGSLNASYDAEKPKLLKRIDQLLDELAVL
jgi:protein-tyrosine-phosphatase